MTRRFLLFLFIAAAAVRANGDVCSKDDKQKGDQACVQAFADEWGKKFAQENVAKSNTGVNSIVSPAQSTTKDFLSKLAAAVSVPMSGNGAQALTLETNVPLHLPMTEEQHLKLQAVLTKPALSDAVTQRLSGNNTALTAVKDSLSELDDLTVSLALDPATGSIGRSITPHLDEYNTMIRARIDRQPAAMLTKAASSAPDAVALVQEFARPYAVLLHNQPQFFGTVAYRARKDVAGPDERSARFTYEMGFHNLNAFHRSNPSCATVTSANAFDCAAALVKFAGTDSGAASGTAPGPDRRADRLALSFEYRASEASTVLLPQYAVNFAASKAHMLVYSLAYGRDGMMAQNGRLDLTVNYEDTTTSMPKDIVAAAARIRPLADAAVTAPVAVRDRFVASATYTYKINDMMAVPVSLVYANHASFLGDVGRKLNAHFGITVKMPTNLP